jgi:hypothetical protein
MSDTAIIETDSEYVKLWKPDGANNTLFVTHITETSATRYKFTTPPSRPQECTFTKGDGITPPRLVIQLLNDEGYTVTNLPNITETDPAAKADQIQHAIEWMHKHGGFEPGDLRKFAYNRAQNSIHLVPLSDLLMEVIGDDEYKRHLRDSLADARRDGWDIAYDDLLNPATHNIEFLQRILLTMRQSLPRETQERLVQLAEDRTGITPPSPKQSSDDADWETATYSDSNVQFDPDALKILEEDGWLNADE